MAELVIDMSPAARRDYFIAEWAARFDRQVIEAFLHDLNFDAYFSPEEREWARSG